MEGSVCQKPEAHVVGHHARNLVSAKEKEIGRVWFNIHSMLFMFI